LSVVIVLTSPFSQAQDYLLNCIAHSHDLVFFKDGRASAQDFLEQLYQLNSSDRSNSSNEFVLNDKSMGAFVGPISGHPKYSHGVVVSIADFKNQYRVDSIYPMDARRAKVVLENKTQSQSPEEDYRIRFWQSKCEW